MAGTPRPPFEIAVSLNPQVEAVTVALSHSQAEANHAVRTEAARYAGRYPLLGRRERLNKRGYLEIRLDLAMGGSVTILARAGGLTEFLSGT